MNNKTTAMTMLNNRSTPLGFGDRGGCSMMTTFRFGDRTHGILKLVDTRIGGLGVIVV